MKQHFLLVLLFQLLYSVYKLTQKFTGFCSENWKCIIFWKSAIFFCKSTYSSSLLKSWLWHSYIILTSFINSQLVAGRRLCICRKYTFKALTWNEVVKEPVTCWCCWWQCSCKGVKVWFLFSCPKTSKILLSSHHLTSVSSFSGLQGWQEVLHFAHRAAAHKVSARQYPCTFASVFGIGATDIWM